MTSGERWLAAGLMLLAVVVMSRGSPAMTGEAPSYLAIAHSIIHDGDIDLRNQYGGDSAYRFAHHTSIALAAYGRDGSLYPAQGLGWGIAVTPVFGTLEAFVNALPESVLQRVRWDRERALRDLLSTVMAALMAWAAVLTLRVANLVGGQRAWNWIAVALAFATPPLLFAGMNAGTEIPAALLTLWFVHEQRRSDHAVWRAAIPLALLPWLHLRYALLVVAGLMWMAKRGRATAAVPIASLVLLALTNVALVGSPITLARPFVSLWQWLASVPSAIAGPEHGLLWIAPFWVIALGGTRHVDRDWPGYARFAWQAAFGLALMTGLFDTSRNFGAARLTLAPALPLLAPLLSQGLSAPSTWARRALAGVTIAWALAVTSKVIVDSGQLVAGANAGPIPSTIASVREWFTPQAALRRRGYAVDDSGFAASIQKGDLDAVRLFLLDPRFPLGKGLVMAVESGNSASTDFLLAQGAAQRPGAVNALTLAREKSLEGAVATLTAAGVTFDVPDPSGQTALIMAVRSRDANQRAMLLAAGADPNVRTRIGQSALIFAIFAGDPAAVSDLIAAGADLDLPDVDGWTPLMVAIRHDRRQSANLLLAAGADVNARSRLGWTPLMWAAYEGSEEYVAALLAAGADPNATSPAGKTALIRAAGRGHLEIVRQLLAAGADSAITIDDEDARAWATRNGHDAVAALIARARRPS